MGGGVGGKTKDDILLDRGEGLIQSKKGLRNLRTAPKHIEQLYRYKVIGIIIDTLVLR